MTRMSMPDTWNDESDLIHHLATQLIRGRLGVFLGSGISAPFNLPSWHQLIAALCKLNGEAEPVKGSDLIKKVAFLRAQYYRGKTEAFKQDLKKALYSNVKADFVDLRKSDLLASIGSLLMASKRGSVSKVITLNYDNLLENYLQYHGFTTATIWSDRHWAESEDVVIYHPHGFLPLLKTSDSQDVVLGTSEYLTIMESPYWKPLIEVALRTHTFLYIGLSGDDIHLNSHWNKLYEHHAIKDDYVYYHGVRFALEGERDEIGQTLEPLRIHTHKLASYDALPNFLFGICQTAREIRTRAP